MKLEVILNGKLTEKQIPISWDQVPYKQFLELFDAGDDYVKAISVFTGVPDETIRKAKIKGLDDIIHVLGFLRKEVVTRVPERIMFYQIPKDLGFETIAQIEDVKTEIAKLAGSEDEDPNDPAKKRAQLEKYPLLCAVFACKHMSRERTLELSYKYPNEDLKYGEYHWLKAEAMQEEFLNAPTPEVLGIGNFTVLKLIGLNLNIKPNYQKPITRTKRLKLVLKRWWLHLVFMEPWYSWRKKHSAKAVS
jgi:hypothetical protein